MAAYVRRWSKFGGRWRLPARSMLRFLNVTLCMNASPSTDRALFWKLSAAPRTGSRGKDSRALASRVFYRSHPRTGKPLGEVGYSQAEPDVCAIGQPY